MLTSTHEHSLILSPHLNPPLYPPSQVEATKFTEVGFHGRDVDQIIRDLVDNAILLVKAKLRRAQASAIAVAVEERILDAIVGSGPGSQQQTRVRAHLRTKLLSE